MSPRKTAKYQVKETIVTVIADEACHPACLAAIRRARADLELFIARDPFFQSTLEPYDCPANAPAIVRRMCVATAQVNVGPMAAVAGTIAEAAVDAMARAGATYALVDNGGDIALLNDEVVTIGIYAWRIADQGPGAGSAPARPHPRHLHVIGHRRAFHQLRQRGRRAHRLGRRRPGRCRRHGIRQPDHGREVPGIGVRLFERSARGDGRAGDHRR